AVSHRSIEEVGTMNFFARIGDELITAPLEGTILGGVTRDSVITLAKGWGMKVSERRLTFDELLKAQGNGSLQEVFGSGTACVIAPIGELGHRGGQLKINNGDVGELSKKLYETINDIQHG